MDSADAPQREAHQVQRAPPHPGLQQPRRGLADVHGPGDADKGRRGVQGSNRGHGRGSDESTPSWTPTESSL